MAKKELEVIEERVKVFAINRKYKEKPFLVTAVTDATTKTYVTGQEHLSKAELSQSELIIDPAKNYMIRNNEELVLRRKGEKYELTRDYAMYCLLMVQPEIAQKQSEAIQGVHLFYIQNLEKEAIEKVSASKSRAKAYAKVVELATLSDMIDMLYFFGENASNMTNSRAEAKIYELVESKPEEVVAYFEKADKSKQIVFIKKLINMSLIRRQTNGYLIYGDVVLGANEEEAAVFVFDDRNNKIYVPLKDMLDKAEKL